MFSTEDFIIAVFCCVDDLWSEITQGKRIRIGQLVERFHLTKIRARDLWHLTSRIYRKLLAHTVALWLNRRSDNPLCFRHLISD